MTYSGDPRAPRGARARRRVQPRFTSTAYDPRFIPAAEKTGALCGMAMTEKQGGSDVRANTTRAVAPPRPRPRAEYELTGHKWFCSAPIATPHRPAQAGRGSCLPLPRFLPDGRGSFPPPSAQDKSANRSNAERGRVDLGLRCDGREGRGVPTIIEMVNHTRLDCVIGSAAAMRRRWRQARITARTAPLRELPPTSRFMRNVLADLALESEAATTAMLPPARALRSGPADDTSGSSAPRNAVVKYWVCKRGRCWSPGARVPGRQGYVEES